MNMNKAEIENRIRELSGQGKGYQEIADALNADNIPGFRGGTWNRGTVIRIVQRLKSETSGSADPAFQADLRKAYQAVLNELDKAMREIGSLNQQVLTMQTEIDLLKSEIRQLTQNETYRQKDIDDMLNTALTQNQTVGSDMLSEILNRLSAIEKQIGMVKPEKKTLNISGWTIQKDGRGFYRGFRNIQGKVRGVYLGKSIDDESLINQKLTSAYQNYTG